MPELKWKMLMMMNKGFIFRDDKCVACKACVASCILENNWSGFPRTIFSRSYQCNYPLAALNLSMACNHCETALCMDCCPALAYSRDALTGAVILNEERCIGCEYCTWNCPFDAPKIIRSKGVIEKCNLCIHLVTDDKLPACVSACPTGALKFGDTDPGKNQKKYQWFPLTDINPKIDFNSGPKEKPLKIIPPDKFVATDYEKPATARHNNNFPLVLFSFLIAISVGLTFSEFLKQGIFQTIPIIIFTVAGGIFSLFHLGRKLRAWRAVLNPVKSPLSREILAYLLYLSFLIAAGLTMLPVIIVASLCTGVFLLISIDYVYKCADHKLLTLIRKSNLLITGIYFSVFFTGYHILFMVFAGFIFLVNLVYILKNKNLLYQGIRVFRLLLLILAALFMVSGYKANDPIFILVVVGGELIGRFMFYEDFETVSIKKSIIN